MRVTALCNSATSTASVPLIVNLPRPRLLAMAISAAAALRQEMKALVSPSWQLSFWAAFARCIIRLKYAP